MKKLILVFVVLASSLAFETLSFAGSNVVCLYFFKDNVWKTVAAYAFFEFDGRKTMSSVSVGVQEKGGGHAMCSRSTQISFGDDEIFEQAHYIVNEPGKGPDALTCDYKGQKPFEVIERKEIYISKGQSALIDSPNLKVIHYVPTKVELADWIAMDYNESALSITNKCVGFVPGAEPFSAKEDPSLDVNINQEFPALN